MNIQSKNQLDSLNTFLVSLEKNIFEKNILKLKFKEFLFISRYFGIGSVSSYFLWLKLSLLDVKMRKKKERQTFRPDMGALFSAINSKINSKFL